MKVIMTGLEHAGAELDLATEGLRAKGYRILSASISEPGTDDHQSPDGRTISFVYVKGE